MKILVIGSGGWPTRICKSLSSKLGEDEVKQISTRDFLYQNLPTLNTIDCIWIATSPEYQISTIRKLVNYSKVVILEKPLFTTLSEFERFNLALKSFKGVAYMSTIWLYNPLWKSLKTSLGTIRSILIKHKYADRRIYCSPALDWIPHDIYLLNDLGLNIHQSSEFSTNYYAVGNMSMRFKFEDNVLVDIRLEKSRHNSFSWAIECMDTSMIKIDFTNRSFIKTYQGNILTNYSDELESNPAFSMVTDMSKSNNSRLQNFIESHFYLIKHSAFPFTSKS